MKIKLIILLILTIGLTGCSRTPHSTTLATDIDTMIASFQTNPSVGIIIQNLETNQTIYQKDASRTFFPASTTKTITATVALAYLGADYQFSTNLAINGKISADGILNGDLVLHFSGDPSFTTTDLQALLNTITQHSIKKINGNIIIDTYPFNGYQPATGFMWDDNNLYFSAPNDGVVLNENAFTFYLWPSATPNTPAVIKPLDSLIFTPVSSSVTTQLMSTDNCFPNLISNAQNHYQLTGCIPYGTGGMKFNVAVNNPDDLLTQFLAHWLVQHHIKLTGQIQIGASPADLVVLDAHYSAPLKNLINTMLYRSDNLYANSLFLTIGAIYTNGLATWENAQQAFIALLNTMHIDTTNMVLIDGAGLSRYNQYSPLLLLAIQQYNYQHPTIGQYYFPALAPYTRYKYLNQIPIAEHGATMRLKTGGMTNVATISAYLVTAKKTPIAIVIMANGDGTRQTFFNLNAQIITRLLKEDL